MSASVGEGSGQDVELNLAPIIDCFTVLITYLLVTASFISLSAMDVGVSQTGVGGPPPPDAGPPPWVMTIELKATGDVTLHARGGPDSKDIPFNVPADAVTHSWNLPALAAQLSDMQKKYPTVADISVSAEPTIIYKDIVTVIHEIQKLMPKVFISG